MAAVDFQNAQYWRASQMALSISLGLVMLPFGKWTHKMFVIFQFSPVIDTALLQTNSEDICDSLI